ncbi:hypothetical protein AWW66_14775 [Micromonospora rosaria]|uniref:Band 7 domain-containing protein n=1 Tax=Micromonospora rosaria TaxID=47874 RepID=A0A136PSX0_9ACTN|nr:paraslipin [Micromonospora rosaria]KXK61236.1 hypothetical protein AWW66_14775 [Micromonospora rosaria]
MEPVAAGLLTAGVVVGVAAVLTRSVRTVPAHRRDLVERLGKYHRTLAPGRAVLVPFVDAVRAEVDLGEQVRDLPPQPVVTADDVVVSVGVGLRYTVADPVRATYEVADVGRALDLLAVTTLRTVVGALDLERTVTGREEIARQLSGALAETTGRWGITVTRVEVRSIEPPPNVMDQGTPPGPAGTRSPLS